MSLPWKTSVRAHIARLDSSGIPEAYLSFRYNPGRLRRTLTSGWVLHRPPGGTIPVPMHGASGGEEISMEVLFYSRDTTHSETRSQLAFLESLVHPRAPSGSSTPQFGLPSMCMLTMGERAWYAVLLNLEVEERMFSKELEPVWATAQLRLAVCLLDNDYEAARLAELDAASTRSSQVSTVPWGA